MRRPKNKLLFAVFSILALLYLPGIECAGQGDKSPDFPEPIPVFTAGSEAVTGYMSKPYWQYREQNILVTNSGKIICIVQGRNASSWSDRSGQDLLCKISEDMGQSWSEEIKMVSEGEKSICPNAAVYDRVKGRIICLYSVFQWPFTDAESRKSWEGLKNREYTIHSDDDGLTWSEPREITHMVKADTLTQVFGSGEGIQLKSGPHKGRLIVPGGDFLPPHKRVFAWISDDHGESWQSSSVVPNPDQRLTPCENAIAELEDGTLLMNERSHRIGQRWHSRSEDGGLSWSPFEPVRDLPSISCNASIIPISYKGKEWILYAGPVGPDPQVKNTKEAYGDKKLSSQEKRRNGVVFASPDGGRSWPVRKLIVPDLFAYSSLMELPDGQIALFYEAGDHRDIQLVRFSPEWLFEEKPEVPNILLIVSEDNGPDLGCYGNPYVYTPRLDQLAEEGVLFENAFVTYSVCSPSRSTIFTGLYPHQNGQIGLATHKFRMFRSFKTLPTYLKEAGYRTGCLGKIHVNPESDIPFDFHPIKSSNFSKRRLPDYAMFADTFINVSPEPFFLMVNFPDAHYPVQKQVEGLPANPLDADDVETLPFVGADSRRLREFTANYYNCMSRLDTVVGILLEKLEQSGKAENTIILYLGDHGAQFSRGKCSNYEAALRVPFIIKWPGTARPSLRQTELVSTIDLLPSILEMCGIQVPGGLPGKSLLPLLKDEKDARGHSHIFADGSGSAAFFYFPKRSVRDKRYKLIYNPLQDRENPKFRYYAEHLGVHFAGGTTISELDSARLEVREAYATWRNPPTYELYDLQEDPLEFKNLSSDPAYGDILEELIRELEKWQAGTNDPLADPEKLARYTAEMDSVARTYEGNAYAKDPSFAWEYPVYFYEDLPENH